MIQVASAAPSVLVAIASYGAGQDHYLARLLKEYRKLRMCVRAVVLTNKPKYVNQAEVVAGLPTQDPYSLPFAHRKLFAENADFHDLFIYSEDDTLISERHIQAFIHVQTQLKEDEIPGFIRSETSPDGSRFITSIHHHFRWRPESIVERDGELFAKLSNEHSGCFMVTREQLRRALASGGFHVPPHSEFYGMLETAASDLYTQCGLQRLISLTRIHDFIVPHLPNKYYSTMGIPVEELELQKQALRELWKDGGWTGKLFEPCSGARGFRWSKNLYERADEPLLGTIPFGTRSVLSVGCGWGENEARLAGKGMQVCAVPLDAVFAASVRKRGIRTVLGPFEEAMEQLGGERFDIVLLDDVLHLLEDPVEWLQRLGRLLEPGGLLIASVPNTCELTAQISDWRNGALRSRVQAVSPRNLRSWCRLAGLKHLSIVPVLDGIKTRLAKVGSVGCSDLRSHPRFILTATRSQTTQ